MVVLVSTFHFGFDGFTKNLSTRWLSVELSRGTRLAVYSFNHVVENEIVQFGRNCWEIDALLWIFKK